MESKSNVFTARNPTPVGTSDPCNQPAQKPAPSCPAEKDPRHLAQQILESVDVQEVISLDWDSHWLDIVQLAAVTVWAAQWRLASEPRPTVQQQVAARAYLEWSDLLRQTPEADELAECKQLLQELELDHLALERIDHDASR